MGSLGGATRLTIDGTGFNDQVQVTIGDNRCEIVEQSEEQLVVLTPPGGVLHVVTNQGNHRGIW